MKTILAALTLLAVVQTQAAPLRVVVIDFVDQSGMASDARLGGGIQPGALAQKGAFLLGKQLVGREGFTLIDRRDLLAQLERLQPKDLGEKTPLKPSFLQAAQALEADIVLRGSILSLSPGKQTVNLGGQKTEQTTLAVRVALEALDTTDGTIIGVADGVVRQSYRQTAQQETELSEDDVLGMMERAVAQALPEVEKAVTAYQSKLANRPKVKFSIKTTEDPALIEVDGLLVGTSPIEGLEVYKGDHNLTISKPGYQNITKKVMIDRGLAIEVPMLREKLTAEELKAIYEKGQLSIYQGVSPNLVIHELK